jgi:DNA primase
MQHFMPTTNTLQDRVFEYYTAVAPIIEAGFAGAPIIYSTVPTPTHQRGEFRVTGIPLSAQGLLGLVRAEDALSFFTWAPLPGESHRLRFARILLEAPPGVGFDRVRLAALAMRAALFESRQWQAVALLDGGNGIALWVPLTDAPQAPPLRSWLHQLCARAVEAHPDLLSTQLNTHHDGRVHLHVSSNAAGRGSALPYSLRPPNCTVCTPIRWGELAQTGGAGAFDDAAIRRRLADCGDVFAAEVARIGDQRFAAEPVIMPTNVEPRGYIITAAIDILDDGKPRSADAILAEALARKLIPGHTKRKYVYTTLIEYIARQIGHGRRSPIVQDAQRRFCINEPPDDWPDLAMPTRALDPAVQALCERVTATATGDDPAAFEVAVCDAFTHLGFVTQHLGGNAEPDGIGDAVLGRLGYRITIECKTGKKVVNAPGAPVEAAKFRDAFHAQSSVLVGPEFEGLLQFMQELQTHAVTALEAADLCALLQGGATALDLQTVLQPGFAGDFIADWHWQRRHGEAKRIATVAALTAREGWSAQLTAAQQGGPANAPRLTVDAAMLLVDAALKTAGSAEACTRDQVRLAFEALTNPSNGIAVWDDDSREAIVVLRPLQTKADSLSS